MKKNLKEIAEKILKFETIIQNSQNAEEIQAAKVEISILSKKIKSLEDMLIIDEIIQKKIKKNSKKY